MCICKNAAKLLQSFDLTVNNICFLCYVNGITYHQAAVFLPFPCTIPIFALPLQRKTDGAFLPMNCDWTCSSVG